MKKAKIFLALVIGVVIGVLASVGVYFLTVGEIAWQEYLETKLIPNAVIVISAIGSLAVAAAPIISKVQLSLSKFDKATSDINETVQVGKSTQDELNAQNEKIASLKADIERLENTVRESVSPLVSSINNTESIVRLGFCNIGEIVNKGYAAEIEKVGAKYAEGKEA